MSITARNGTDLPLKIKDYYIYDPERSVGYYGALEYAIPAGGRKSIPCAIFTQKMMEELRPQEIRLLSGEQVLLVLQHDAFGNNRGNEVIFNMEDNGLLVATFARIAEIRLPQRIWRMFCFRRAGADIQVPV